MLFNSFQFLYLFPLVFVGYYALSWLLGREVQGKGSNRLLLLVSYGLYPTIIVQSRLNGRGR